MDTVILLCTVIETADRLETLTESDQNGCEHHHNPVDAGHGRLCRIDHHGPCYIQADGMIQTGGRDTGNSLTGKRRKPTLHDSFQIIGVGTEVFQLYFHIVAPPQTNGENGEAHTLADRCRESRTGDAHTRSESCMKTGHTDRIPSTKDQDRIQKQIQHRSGRQSDH